MNTGIAFGASLVEVLTLSLLVCAQSASSFEGRIQATLTRAGETQSLRYTVSSNQLRVERTETNWPHAVNIVDLSTSAVTLVFPHNRSFVRLENGTGVPPGSPDQSTTTKMTMPPAGLQPSMAVVAAMSAMPRENLKLKATGGTTDLLGLACARYKLKQRGEMMEIWATDKLIPFQPWLPNQSPRSGPRLIEEQWSEMLKAKKLFPLLAVLRFEHGPERLRFEVKSVKQEKVTDPDGKLFQPPPGYREVEPLPF